MRRTAVILSIAGLAPVVVLAISVLATSLRDETQRQIAETLAIAREINASVDGEFMADRAALEVFASSQFIKRGDYPGAVERGRQVMQVRRGWSDVMLTEVATRTQVWSGRNGVKQEPARPEVLAFLDYPAGRTAVGGVSGQGPGCPCIALSTMTRSDAGAAYVLTAERVTDPIQQRLVAGVGTLRQARTVGAVVDRTGNFAARTIHWRDRVGKPATRFVRDAIRTGRAGVYDGFTYEGLKNRSVFHKSAYSGYSTHIALPADNFEWRGQGAIALTLLATIVALIMAAAGVLYALRHQADWRQEQARLIQSQKMEALGQFASGVAHDFNNLLSVMLGSFEALANRVTQPQDVRRVELGKLAVEKSTRLTEELLNFARQKPVELQAVELGPMLDGMRGIVQRTLGNKFQLEMASEPSSLSVITNRSALEMAVINLAANARDAMPPTDGRLTIRVERSKTSDCIDLIVADNGAGMSPETMRRALDPFFTTKKAGEGTGLGLAQVHSLMLQSHGQITIDSKPGTGTRITLIFPEARREHDQT